MGKEPGEQMVVWVENYDCCGGGPCTIEGAASLFGRDEEGFAHTQLGGRIRPDGMSGKIVVPINLEAAVVNAKKACPGQCIKFAFESMASLEKSGLAAP